MNIKQEYDTDINPGDLVISIHDYQIGMIIEETTIDDDLVYNVLWANTCTVHLHSAQYLISFDSIKEKQLDLLTRET